MNIIISNADSKPIYQQIYTQIKQSILSGGLAQGDMLPSIRMLAKDLRISVITTKRAYEELEKDGYIYTVGGKGSYVAEKNLDLLRETHLKQIEEYMEKINELAPACNLSQEDLFQMMRLLQKEW